MPSPIRPVPLFLPPAPMSLRLLAAICDFMLIGLTCLFFIGKLWMPIYATDAMLEFNCLLDTYMPNLLQGQWEPLLEQIKNSPSLLNLFQSIDHLIFINTWIYYAVNACFLRGGTVGKEIFNLRVLSIYNLQPQPIINRIIRAGLLSFCLLTAWPFLMVMTGCFMAINKLHRGFHDQLCQTYVVRCSALEQMKSQIVKAVQQAVDADKSA